MSVEEDRSLAIHHGPNAQLTSLTLTGHSTSKVSSTLEIIALHLLKSRCIIFHLIHGTVLTLNQRARLRWYKRIGIWEDFVANGQ